MAANNFKLFDENKQNMLSDQEYQASQQRLGGVQAGIASSMLNNKFAYQMSLIAYAIAQMMNANGYDATDALAVSAFVGNLSNSVLQKVIDKATTAEAQAGTNTLKWMTPALVKSFFDYRLATQAEAQAGSIDTKWMSPAKVKAFYNYWKATASEATEGTNDTKWMSPLKVAQVVAPVVNASWVLLNEYTIAGSYTWTAPDLFNGKSYKIGVVVIGGGGGGGVAGRLSSGSYQRNASASGGGSGHAKFLILTVTPGSGYNLVVGAGGAGNSVSSYGGASGSSGSSSSFGNHVADGGSGGTGAGASGNTSAGAAVGAEGGQGSDYSTSKSKSPPVCAYEGRSITYASTGDQLLTGRTMPGECMNPFTKLPLLVAGGSVYILATVDGLDDSSFAQASPAGIEGSAGCMAHKENATAVAGNAPGSGGGAAVMNYTSSVSARATSAAGADGAVMIYVMGVEA